MLTITISEQNISNLKIFLSRTSLTGQEVPAFNEIIKSIYEAKEVQGEKPKKVGE